MTDILPLYHQAPRYDRMFHKESDLPYWRKQIQGKALELACGTGRILLNLAANGVEAYGLDNSEAMLAHLRAKAQKARLNIPVKTGDMRAFDYEEHFDHIILAGNSLGHLYTRADIEAHFAAVREALAKDGHYHLDYFVPKADFLTLQAQKRRHLFDFLEPSDEQTTSLYDEGQYNAASQIREARWIYMRGDTVLGEEVFRIRMFYPQELDALLEYNGFRIRAKYGDYDLRPFDANASQQIIVAERD